MVSSEIVCHWSTHSGNDESFQKRSGKGSRSRRKSKRSKPNSGQSEVGAVSKGKASLEQIAEVAIGNIDPSLNQVDALSSNTQAICADDEQIETLQSELLNLTKEISIKDILIGDLQSKVSKLELDLIKHPKQLSAVCVQTTNIPPAPALPFPRCVCGRTVLNELEPVDISGTRSNTGI